MDKLSFVVEEANVCADARDVFVYAIVVELVVLAFGRLEHDLVPNRGVHGDGLLDSSHECCKLFVVGWLDW